MILSLEDFNKMGEFLHGLTWRGAFARTAYYTSTAHYTSVYICNIARGFNPVTEVVSQIMVHKVALKRLEGWLGCSWSPEGEELVQQALKSINEGKK
jgi:hypothetical protein